MGLPIWAVAYGTTAMTTALLIKVLIVHFQFRAFAVLVAAQGLATIVVVKSTASTDISEFRKQMPRSIFLLMMPAAFTLCSIALGFWAQVFVNVPMMLVLRRTNTIFTLVAERIFLGNKPPVMVIASCGVIVFGALLAGYRDLRFDGVGYFVVFLQNCATTGGTISMSMLSKSKSLSLDGPSLSLVSTMCSWPLLLTWAVVSGDIWQFGGYPANGWLLLLAVTVIGGLNSITQTLSVTRHSPLTTSIAGNTKDLLQTLVGGYAFDDYLYDPVNAVGICFSFIGCALYAYAKSPGKGDKKN
eukprot:gnl/MRDRNA2_/MRDRNA2_90130_c0_seq1.p1 gnl/MRDRNA2_/MRDRNA2_90130_c0~~gnl/MRDRNA2_/MRDRNA2_90130_c0_seq1.p1  ORF type:complete len:300 (-),score=39.29 gnl/MRDRNA2_/MRDRNA2_90130_c0_seq1:99-998(-)